MGLLDGFFGNADQTQALGLLGAHMMAGNTAGGFQAANGLLGSAPERALKQKLSQMQVDNYASEIEARKLKAVQDQRQQRLLESFFPGLGGAPASPGMPPAGAAPGVPGAPGGMPPSAAPGAMPAGPGAPAGAPASPGGGNDILALSQRLGIPPQAIQADMVFNGGKGIAEMLYKRGSPDMQVTNGFAYDKNRVGPGYLPQLNVSQNGQTSMVQIGQDGLPVVSAPRGALDTFRGYQDAQEGTKASYDPVTVQPAGQAPQMTSRRALMTNPQVQGQNVVPPAVQAERDAAATQIKQTELVRAQAQLKQALQMGDQSAAARAQGDIAALQRELGGRTATVGMPLASEEDKLRGQKGVEGDSKTNEARANDVKTAQRFLSVAKQAGEVLKQGPTSSGIGSAVDSAAALVGYATPGSVSAQQLTALGGWLTANVPRMEGPQSNFDVGNYQRMAADVGNPMLPIKRRQAALQTITQMMQNIADSGGMPNTGGATGDFGGKSSAVSAGGWSASLKK